MTRCGNFLGAYHPQPLVPLPGLVHMFLPGCLISIQFSFLGSQEVTDTCSLLRASQGPWELTLLLLQDLMLAESTAAQSPGKAASPEEGWRWGGQGSWVSPVNLVVFRFSVRQARQAVGVSPGQPRACEEVVKGECLFCRWQCPPGTFVAKGLWPANAVATILSSSQLPCMSVHVHV